MATNGNNTQYDLMCEQICNQLGYQFRDTQDGIIFLKDGSFLSLTDCAPLLLQKCKGMQEIIGELKTDINRFKNGIVELKKQQNSK